MPKFDRIGHTGAREMKKLLFIIFGISLGFINKSEGLVCVANTEQPNSMTEQFVKAYDNMYLKCGGDGDPFVTCNENTIVDSYDGNLYKCKGTKWIKILPREIPDCTQDLSREGLATVERKYEGISNFGSLIHINDDDLDQNEYIYYYTDNPKVGYSAIKNYCKYPKSNYYQLSGECEGVFMDWYSDSNAIIPCNQEYNDKISITVQDNNGTALPEVEITYKDLLYDEETYTTDSSGAATISVDKRARAFKIKFSKDGFVDVIKPISAVRAKPVVQMEPVNSDQTDGRGDGEEEESENPQSVTGAPGEPPAPAAVDKESEVAAAAAALAGVNIPDVNYDEIIEKAEKTYQEARDKEQSWANRLVSGASTAATGLGAMQLASGLAEQQADKEAEADMREYLATMKCKYGNGEWVTVGNEDITMPGGNELLNYYSEYKSLADSLKTTKTALGLRPGIESETLYDKAESGLYQYASIGKQSAASEDIFSLSRALTDETSDDAAAYAAQQEKSGKKVAAGAIATGVGAVGGLAGNIAINHTEKSDKGKDK